MMEFGSCPICKQDISEERRRQRPVICNHCGFTATQTSQQVQNQVEKRTIIWMSAICFSIVAGYLVLMNWDKHSLSIIPLTVKETFGGMTPADHEKKSEICMDLKKWDCVESAYTHIAQNDQSAWRRVGDFQMKRAKYSEAAQSYYRFLQGGGQDLGVSYSYAKALAELGQVDEAVKYFDEVLAAKPDVLQVTVVQNYVKLLVEHKRYDQARTLIEGTRTRGGPTAGMFMEAEMKQIQALTTASRE